MSTITEGTLLWEPSPTLSDGSELRRYMRWLAERQGRAYDTYAALWEWSVSDLPGFWASLWDFFAIRSATPYTAVLPRAAMPGAEWFPGAQLNYTEHIFRAKRADHPAILFQSETQPLTAIGWDELERQVAAVAAALRELGVRPGDRVVGYLPNTPHAVVALLATASLGAIWSSCSPDFGSPSVIDRFKQIEPKVLFAVDGYRYGGKAHDRRAVVAEIQRALPTLERTVLIPYLDAQSNAAGLERALLWSELLQHDAPLRCEPVPFMHPLWILYSSGTTGLPKPIVHSQGGILLEHFKMLALHHDLKPGDRFFWFTTTGWMMWNYLVSGLLVGATILLYDGSPAYPDLGVLWRFAQETGMTLFGTSAAYIGACMKAGLEPARQYDLSRLRSMGSTGSPLPPEGFVWAYQHVKRDLWLASVSGGTDLCTAFVGGCPLLPVYAGELQCRCLGAAVQAFDEAGRPVIEQVGELVITAPMPSMPIYFWNDPDYRRYRESYFEMYPGVWRHGDWIKITRRGTAVIYGRSDSTINRMGIRMGTSEFYRVVEGVPEVLDSLVIDLEGLGGEPYLALFVVLREGAQLDQELRERIKRTIREALSPRHVPDDIFQIPEVPRTLNGKKLEVPIKKIFMGVPPEKAANPDAMSNPQILSYFVELAQRRRRAQP
ncbi:acetoacetate--CoA ligase [Kallotenue papyrolyticum]|uniref:acetoacetate--CoA ligase n=1 Tax=Kallotenue papyrolyticum TaxID=1325125 RepID=UPI00047866C3|nr:acetoacetate--CoA ligase [Kallotenue papyrolyticum]